MPSHSSLPTLAHAGNLEAQQLPSSAAYEVLAFMSKANAKPIGTKSVRFFGTNIDISDLGLSDPYLREWPGHSFQFHFDAATTSQFWKRVVRIIRWPALENLIQRI